MRFLTLLSAVFLASCASVPGDQVSKSFPEALPGGLTLPSMQSFAQTPSAQTTYSNAQLADLFLRLEFQLESGRDLMRISRFEGPITIAMTGRAPTGAQAELARLLTRFQNEAGLNVTTTNDPLTASITVNFVAKAEANRLVPGAACLVVPGVSSLDGYRAARGTTQVDWAHVTQRSRVAVFVPDSISPQEVRDCLNEELAQAMGPLNDLYELSGSVFNDDNFHNVLPDFDMLMLRLHHAPDLQSRMNEAQVASLLPDLLARYNPQGANGSGVRAPTPSPASWNSLVARAMGLGGAGGRKAAADQMIQMAMAQGWTDTRAGLGYFLSGRLAAQTNPTLAINHLSRASEIYRALPGGDLQSAHVDLQLAAIALSANQNEQAIALVDRSYGAVMAAQNAAMLSTLLLIKAQALEDLGRDAEAQALRLDTLGWARYGFGSDQAMRAKTAEISALAARG